MITAMVKTTAFMTILRVKMILLLRIVIRSSSLNVHRSITDVFNAQSTTAVISGRLYLVICQRCTTSVDIQNTRYKKLFTHVESHASAVSLLESGE